MGGSRDGEAGALQELEADGDLEDDEREYAGERRRREPGRDDALVDLRVVEVGDLRPPSLLATTSLSRLGSMDSASVARLLARPQPRPMMHIVALTARLAGMPRNERKVMRLALTISTMSDARRGRSVRSFPTVSSVRRAMVNAPRPMAAAASRMPTSTSSAPLPTRGAMAFATLLAPALNAI